MRRREFITLLGGAAVAWPLAARAQQPAMAVIGYFNIGSPEGTAHLVAAFRKGLSEAGYVEGHNVAIEYRWGHNDRDRIPELAADLVRRQVTVIAAPESVSAALAAKALTSTIPIVFSTLTDPVESGLVSSLNRPGGNVTGIASMGIEIGGKQFGLLRELLPSARRFAMLVNPTSPAVAEPIIREIRTAASAMGHEVEIFLAGTSHEIDAVFRTLSFRRIEALMISPHRLFSSRRVQLSTSAARHAVPAIYHTREFAEAGGLMSYGANSSEGYRQVGIYTGRVLKGEKPANLPVMRATNFEFVINLQTARIFDITVPPTLLARADEVIE